MSTSFKNPTRSVQKSLREPCNAYGNIQDWVKKHNKASQESVQHLQPDLNCWHSVTYCCGPGKPCIGGRGGAAPGVKLAIAPPETGGGGIDRGGPFATGGGGGGILGGIPIGALGGGGGGACGGGGRTVEGGGLG